MNNQNNSFLKQPDQHRVPVYQWTTSAPRAVIHISHGMGEHSLRYASLAACLNDAGFIVYAHDHRGHGKNTEQHPTGHFADHQGWDRAVSDITSVVTYIQEKHSELPVFLLGHSMGSYLLQSYLIQHKPDISGVILSGSNYTAQPLMWFARGVAWLETQRQGKTGYSKLIERLTFSDFNRRFKPQRTDFDWLSRDSTQVDAYINDPLCGFPCTNQLWADLFAGLQSICSVRPLKQLSKELPILVMGGAEDPVSAPKGQQTLAAAYQKAGMLDVTTHIYPEGRHEMFNETNREQVIQRLIQWVNNYLTEVKSET